MAMVRFEHVGKSYGPATVIHDLNLEIRDREFMVLVGPSGCGKSTALRMIAGLEEVSDGRIVIGERVVNDLPPKDRDIAMVFQNYALYPHMTVRENLEFGLRMRKRPRAEIDRLVADASEILGIDSLLERRPKQLSGGQRQRVAVGRAIVRQPSVFLFDEPLSNLDAKLRVQMRAEISKLQQRLETTTVYVTHDQVEAMTMGHRIAVMKDGRLMQVGPPLELYEHPANLFVAGFLGTPPMNIFRAAIDAGGTGLSAPGIALPLPARWRSAGNARAGREVFAGIRPEHLRGAARSDRSSEGTISGRVEIVEPLGHEAVVHLRTAGALLVAKFAPHDAPRVGDSVELLVELDRLQLFDPETEQRLAA